MPGPAARPRRRDRLHRGSGRAAARRLHKALHTLGILALDEVEAAEMAREEMRQEVREAKGIPEPGKRKERAGTD